MTIVDERKLDMLLRVSEFGKTHSDLFAPSSEGGRALATLTGATDQLTQLAVAKVTIRNGRNRKSQLKQVLLEHLDEVNRNVRVIERDIPSFGDGFKYSRLRSSRALITTGRAFVQEAAKAKDRFIALKMPETFISDLSSIVDEFEQAVRDWESGRKAYAAARKNIESAFAAAYDVLPKLDIIVANQFKDDPAMMGEWESGRRVEVRKARRVKPAAPATASASAEPRKAVA